MSPKNSSTPPPLRAAILIASDRAASGIRQDETLPLLSRHLEARGVTLAQTEVLPDDKNKIVATLRKWANPDIDIILVSGGTGVSPLDVTPEATLEVIERRIPGIEEAMRYASMQKTPFAMLSRAVAGIVRSTLIINLPGKPAAAVENLAVIDPVLSHAVELIRGGNPHE
jgi:molybdopterin adenylyltransferase